MAIAKAVTKYARVSPSKARLVVDIIRGMPVMEALYQLSHLTNKSARHLKKTLISAIANAEHNNDAKREELYISEAKIDKGAYYKRAWTRSRGMRAPIIRKTSHITIAVDSLATKEKGK